MNEPVFFKCGRALAANEIAELAGAGTTEKIPTGLHITNIAPLDRAGPRDVAFFDDARSKDAAARTRAGICLTTAALAPFLRDGIAVLRCRDPHDAFVRVAQGLFPDAGRASPFLASAAAAPGRNIHPTARLENEVTVDAGALIGPRAEIGSGTVIAPMAVIGADVRIGRACFIGPGAAVTHALIGDRVTIRAGCMIGDEDSTRRAGYALREPAVGRVIIQDSVEIDAGAAIGRGTLADTVIGEGSRIGSLVSIGSNTSIGRMCVLLTQAGISAGVILEDHVMVGARAGLAQGIIVGEGASIATATAIHVDVPRAH